MDAMASAGVRAILSLPSSRGRQPCLPMDLRFEKWRRSFASARVRLGVFGSKPWTMDCFQVTKLRRITKRRFNELATQARERLPLDLIGHAPGGVQCHAHSSVLRTQRKRRHVPCRQGAVTICAAI